MASELKFQQQIDSDSASPGQIRCTNHKQTETESFVYLQSKCDIMLYKGHVTTPVFLSLPEQYEE